MHLPLVILRLIHVVAGTLWVGFAVFVHVYLGPAVGDAGPEGGKVMGALQRRGLMTVLPILALLTVLSGFWVYWLVSGGLEAEYVRSATGLTFGIGGLVALAAYLIGMFLTRPAMLRAAAAMQAMATAATAEERERLQAEATRQRGKGHAAGSVGTTLLILAAIGMAVARYL